MIQYLTSASRCWQISLELLVHLQKISIAGCNADGIHMECRFCDAKPFLDVPCPPEFRPPYPTDESLGISLWNWKNTQNFETSSNECPDRCYFPQGTRQSYYWDNNCQLGLSGCYADGIHEQCRYCGHGSGGAFKHIPCPKRTIFPWEARVAGWRCTNANDLVQCMIFALLLQVFEGRALSWWVPLSL